MAKFSSEQLEQLQSLFAPVHAKLGDLDKKVCDLDRQVGGLVETSVGHSVRTHFGHSFSKKFTVVSLQHLAKLLCRSTGWSYGNTPTDVCRVAEKLARQLSSQQVAETLLQDVFTALVQSSDGQDSFAVAGKQLQANPWFDNSGNLNVAALGRSLPYFPEEGRKQEGIKIKMQKLHRFLSIVDEEGKSKHGPDCSSQLLKTNTCFHAERIIHMSTCRSVGVMLALFAAQPLEFNADVATTFEELAQNLPSLQLHIDVRGKVVMIKNQVTIEVGEIKRNSKQYKEAKHQLIQRVKLLQWAMTTAVNAPLEFVLIGHLFIQRGQPDDTFPNNEVADDVSTFTHQM